MSGLAGIVAWIGPDMVSASQVLQLVDLAAIEEASVAVRAAAAFVVLVGFGGVILLRDESYISTGVDAFLSYPLRAFGYGLVAHAVLAFGVAYLGNQLSAYTISGYNVGTVSFLVGFVAFLAVSALGFLVVGSTVFSLWGQPNAWGGLIVGGMIGGGVALGPIQVAAVLWVAIVSLGIGGRIRNWAHASMRDDLQPAA